MMSSLGKHLNIYLLFISLATWADDRIIAWVGDEVITQKELDYYVSREGMAKDEALEEIINLLIFEKRAKELNIVSSEKVFTDEIFKKRTKQEFAKAKIINLFRERISIGEDDVLSIFNKYKEEVNVDFLEFDNENHAEKVFLELSRDGTTTERIETSGFFCFPEMHEEFSKIAFSLDPGKISHPFKIKGKFYIIKGDKKRKTSTSHLSKIRDELFMEQRGIVRKKTPNENTDDILSEILSLIEEGLKNKKLEGYLKEFLDKTKSSVYIKING